MPRENWQKNKAVGWHSRALCLLRKNCNVLTLQVRSKGKIGDQSPRSMEVLPQET